MCKGFHHCPSPWWWECSIRNRQLSDKQVDRTNYTNTNTTSGPRAYHSYPEQEVYRTKDHQRLQEPEQRSAVLKKNKNKNKTCFKFTLGKPAVYRIFPTTVRDWNNVGEFTASVKSWRWWQCSISSRLMAATKETPLLDLWPQLKTQLFSIHGHN